MMCGFGITKILILMTVLQYPVYKDYIIDFDKTNRENDQKFIKVQKS